MTRHLSSIDSIFKEKITDMMKNEFEVLRKRRRIFEKKERRKDLRRK